MLKSNQVAAAINGNIKNRAVSRNCCFAEKPALKNFNRLAAAKICCKALAVYTKINFPEFGPTTARHWRPPIPAPSVGPILANETFHISSEVGPRTFGVPFELRCFPRRHKISTLHPNNKKSFLNLFLFLRLKMWKWLGDYRIIKNSISVFFRKIPKCNLEMLSISTLKLF